MVSGGSKDDGSGTLDTPAYLAVALHSGLTLADLYHIPMGWVIDIAAILSGKAADIVDVDDMSDSDFFGGL